MDFGDFSDNPFALQPSTASRPRRQALVTAAKYLALVAVCLSLTVVGSSLTNKWLVHRLTHDFESLSSREKQVRLAQIADLGPPAIEPLVSTLADRDLEVARTAYDSLVQAQNNWTALPSSERERCYRTLVQALETVAVQLPDDRTGWGTNLLQQTVLSTIDRRDDRSQSLYRSAMHAMELLSLSDRSGPSILSDEPFDASTPRRLTVQAQPLPVASVSSARSWTDWPPPENDSLVNQVTQSGSPPRLDSGEIGKAPVIDEPQEPKSAAAESPSLYRSSGAGLQPLRADDPVILREISRAHETAYETGSGGSNEIRSVTHLVDSPMETFDDRSVIRWLGSPHRTLQEKARTELIKRGYGDTELAIATQIASNDPKTRIELAESISRSDAVDPRPWLLMLLQDPHRDVKLRVISVLATMNDPRVTRRLRTHLVGESDPTVAARIRRVLDLR